MKKFAYIIIIIVLCVLFLEITLRIIGFTPVVFRQKIISKPEVCYSSDSLGISLKKGNYKININDCIEYTATHNSDGRRITSKTPITAPNKIFILGCSYAYGVGVSDEKTYPFLLQNKLLNYQVYNYGIPGSGTMQHYLKLQKSLENGNRPTIVVLSYATFHEERNQLTRSFESKLINGINIHKGLVFSKFYYPRCTIQNQKIIVEYVNILKDFFPIPFAKHLAISNFIDQIWEQINYKKTEGFPVSKLIFKNFQKLSKQYHFKLIIADVFYNEKSKEIQSFCFKNNLNYINISPDFSKGDSWSLAPCDPHPNNSTHKVYSDKLYKYLKNNKLDE